MSWCCSCFTPWHGPCRRPCQPWRRSPGPQGSSCRAEKEKNTNLITGLNLTTVVTLQKILCRLATLLLFLSLCWVTIILSKISRYQWHIQTISIRMAGRQRERNSKRIINQSKILCICGCIFHFWQLIKNDSSLNSTSFKTTYTMIVYRAACHN